MKYHVIFGVAAVMYIILGVGVSIKQNSLRVVKRQEPSFTGCDVDGDKSRLIDTFKSIGITDMIDALTKLRSDMITVQSPTKVIQKVETIRDRVTSLMDAISDFKGKQSSLVRFVTYPYKLRFAKNAENALRTYLESSILLYTRSMSQLRLDMFTSTDLNVNTIKGKLAKNLKKSLKKANKSATKEQKIMLKEVTEAFNILNKYVITISKYAKLITKEFKKFAREPVNVDAPCYAPGEGECNCGSSGSCFSIPGLFSYCDCGINYFGEECKSRYTRSTWPKCTAYGDVHVVTFDDAKFHFQGTCLYLLSKLETEGSNGRIMKIWEVFQQNWIKHGAGQQVSWPRSMYLKLYGQRVVESHQNSVVYGIHQWMDGSPNITRDGKQIGYGNETWVDPGDANFILNVRISPSGKFTTISVESRGVEIRFDGDWDTYVKISPSLKTIVQGICRNANDQSDDDYKMKDGTDVRHENNRGRLIGDSFQVKDNTIEPSSETCQPNGIPDEPWLETDRERFHLTELYCYYSDCGRDKQSFKWNSCVVDSYFAVSKEEKCDILKKQVFLKSDCADGIFDCCATMIEAHRNANLTTSYYYDYYDVVC
ncbi:unnamed protein product [Owenia fusiformis]|uniref:VWFD domain-containing protein n=1 Tax=Owenia fusiformis TaxID=6347 RepID=A0A8S4PYH5_OWEFU|nr:unnamed protein product [Owenia fusiformis]